MELSILYTKIRYNVIPLLEVARFRYKVVNSFLKSLVLIVSQIMRNPQSSHNKGMDHFYANDFEVALQCFQGVLDYQESDHLAKMMIERCTKNMQK